MGGFQNIYECLNERTFGSRRVSVFVATREPASTDDLPI